MAEVRPLVDEESGIVFSWWDSVFGTVRQNRDSVFLNKKIPRCARDSGEGKVVVMDSNKSPRCARETLSRLKTKHCPRMTLCRAATAAVPLLVVRLFGAGYHGAPVSFWRLSLR